ncbi:MAG TPA: winged helix-turn-helix transcriptional regulator, partial [Acidimicrobiia bacterium]|nr:winged helix-turn-helix transcriptional regulator [Acidimicrobiia bacterium]
QYSERPDRFEYRLTEKGVDLYPVLVSLLRWGDRWMAGDAELPITLRHRSCGQIIEPELTCPACGEAITARDMEALTPARV